MASTPILPFATWAAGTNQNSIPANDNALRAEIFQRNVNNATTAQPVSPTDGDSYIIQSTHTGAQWSTFTPKDLAIYKGGTWYAFAPVEGNRVTVSGQVYVYSGGSWSAATGGAYDMLSTLTAAEISVTGATTATIGRMHVCSGTSADYTLTLPAVSGNAGKFLGVRIGVACTRWITLDGNASELIDGALTRRMWRHESAILYCDGASWTKVAGKTIPLKCTMNKTNTTSIAPLAWTLMPVNNVVRDNASFMATPLADTSSGWIRILRGGSYIVTGFSNFTAVASGKLQTAGVVNRKLSPPGGLGPMDPGDDPNAWSGYPLTATGDVYLQASAAFDGVLVGDSFAITTYNNDTVARSNSTGTTVRPSISAVEVPDW